MLTPHAGDKNRVKQLKIRKLHPEKFGPQAIKLDNAKLDESKKELAKGQAVLAEGQADLDKAAESLAANIAAFEKDPKAYMKGKG